MHKTRGIINSLLGAVFVLCLLAGFNPAGAAEAGWKLLHSESEHSEYFYDKGSLDKSAEGIVTVMTKVVYGKEGKAEVLESRGNAKAYQDLAYTLYQYGINCATRQSRLQQIAHVDAKGKRIAEFNLVGKTEWEAIPVGSRLDMLADEECPPVDEP
jgi:surface-adhesin protein E